MPVHLELDLRDSEVCIITRNDGLWYRLFPLPPRREALVSAARQRSWFDWHWGERCCSSASVRVSSPRWPRFTRTCFGAWLLSPPSPSVAVLVAAQGSGEGGRELQGPQGEERPARPHSQAGGGCPGAARQQKHSTAQPRFARKVPATRAACMVALRRALTGLPCLPRSCRLPGKRYEMTRQR